MITRTKSLRAPFQVFQQVFQVTALYYIATKYKTLWIFYVIIFVLIWLRYQITVEIPEINNLFYTPSLRKSILYPSPSYLFPSHLKSPLDISISIVLVLTDGGQDALKLLLNSLKNIYNPNMIEINLLFVIRNVVSSDKINMARTFEWPHGTSKVTKKYTNEPWNPSSENEYSLILHEDSAAISPTCIIWIESVLSKILSDNSKKGDRIIGISVALSLSFNVVAIANSLPVSENNKNFPVLYQAATISGVLYFPDSWRVLNDIITINRDIDEIGSLDNFLLEFMSKNGLFVVYPKFEVVSTSGTKYAVPSDANAIKSLNSAHLDDFPIFDSHDNPILGRNQLIDAIDRIEDLSNADVNLNSKRGYTNNGMLVSSLNISFFQHPVISQQHTYKGYRLSVCNAFKKLYETNRILADPRYITVMISTMHRFPIVLQQLLYYSRSPIVSTIIVTWHNMRIPAPKSVLIGKTMVYFVVPSFDSLNNRFLPDDRINTASVLIIDDDMKVHLDDLQVLHVVWSRYSSNIVGFSPRWFRTTKDTPIPHLEYTYNKFKPVPKIKKNNTTSPLTAYGIMLTKVMMMRSSYLHEYTCGWMTANDKKIAENDHLKLLDSVTEMKNCEDVFINGIIANNIFAGTESPVLFVSPLHNVGDFGTVGSKYKSLHWTNSTSVKESKTKSWLDIRSECLNTIDSVIRKYSKERLQLQTHLFLSSQESNVINLKSSTKNYDKYFMLNCDSKKKKKVEEAVALNDPSCEWSEDINFSTQILLPNFI